MEINNTFLSLEVLMQFIVAQKILLNLIQQTHTMPDKGALKLIGILILHLSDVLHDKLGLLKVVI